MPALLAFQDVASLSFLSQKKPYLERRAELEEEGGAGVTFDL